MENNNQVQIIGGGLKCDARNCDYVNDTIQIDDYVQWIDAPCPQCGANLLTQADYDQVQIMKAAVSIVNGMSPAHLAAIEQATSVILGKTPDPNQQALMRFDFNGSGNVDMNITTDPDEIKKRLNDE